MEAETVSEYLEWILERIHLTQTVQMPVGRALGMALAEDIIAKNDLPIWDSSAMDGYAVHASDIAEATSDAPSILRVVGEVAAGSGNDPDIPKGCAVRIMTGAPVPSQADAVVPVEHTSANNIAGWGSDEIAVLKSLATGANIRRRSEDITSGERIAESGDYLSAARLSAVTAVGYSEVLVKRSPRIAVLSTGSELQAPGASLSPGQIHESNSVLIAGLLQEAGFRVDSIGHTADTADVLRQQLAELANTHDLVITTGGVGPGKYDVVRIALQNEPGIRSLRVAVKPGQPQCSGLHSGGAYFFGLPGNPVSAAVSFELFVRPALRKMAGYKQFLSTKISVVAGESWEGRPGRLQVIPVLFEQSGQGLVCKPAISPNRVSHSVGSFGNAQGYALIEAERGDIVAGEPVQVVVMGNP